MNEILKSLVKFTDEREILNLINRQTELMSTNNSSDHKHYLMFLMMAYVAKGIVIENARENKTNVSHEADRLFSEMNAGAAIAERFSKLN